MAFKIITKGTLKEKKLELRKANVQKMKVPAHSKQAMLEQLSTSVIPKAQFAEGFDIKKFVRTNTGKEGTVAEFIGTGDFASQFYQRQRYEVDAGRDDEPIMYDALYAVVVDANLPRLISINTLGKAGVIFEQVQEGGQVKFVRVSQGSKSVTIQLYATGIEYDEDVFMYNELFRLANIERQFGVAHNALLNNIHFSPILTATYGTANKTDGTALTSFKTSASMPEKYLRAIEATITAAATDSKNARRGPYALLVSSGDLFTVERALNRVPQQGFDLQSSALSRIQSIIAYDGWTGDRGKKSVTYNGVATGKAYLVHLGHRTMDFQSYFKHTLRVAQDQGDLMRYIMARSRYDVRLGVFADPTRAVHEITLPVAASGSA